MCNVHPARCILIMIEIPFLYNTIYIPQVFALNPNSEKGTISCEPKADFSGH